MKVRIVIEYDYEGEAVTPKDAETSEREAWIAGDVSVWDIVQFSDGKFEVVVE